MRLAVSMFAHTRDSIPEPCILDFPDAFDAFRDADPSVDRGFLDHDRRGNLVETVGKDGPLWSPAIFGPSPLVQYTYRKGEGRVISCDIGQTRRNLPCVVSVCALVLDYDHGDVPAEDIVARWAQYTHVLHSTYTPGRWRVILPYAALVPVATHDAVYAWALARAGEGADGSTKDASRIFYWPTCRTDIDTDPVFGYNQGELLDPARIDLPRGAPRTRTSGSPSSNPPPPRSEFTFAARGGGEAEGPYGGIENVEQREDLALIESRCRFMAHVRADMHRDGARRVEQPEWYAALGIIARCRGGDDLAHEVSSPYPTYSPDETEETYQRAKVSAGPRTCADIRTLSEACRGCTLQVTSPVLLGRAAAQPAGRAAAEVAVAKASAHLGDAPAGAPAAADDDLQPDLLGAVQEAEARYQQARLVEDETIRVLEAARRRLATVRSTKHASEDDVAEALVALSAAREQHRVAERVRKAREKEHVALKKKVGVEGLPPGADPGVWQQLRMSRDGTPLAVMANVLTVLEADPKWSSRLSYDAFASEVCLDGAPLPEAAATRLVGKLGTDYHLDIHTPTLLEATRAVAVERTFHPIQQWLATLRWDGTPRVRDLLTGGFDADPAGDEDLVRTIGEQFIVSLVARAMQAGCQVDTMLVLAGKQGMYKSTGLESLVGTDWFLSTKLDLSNKDSFISLRGKWLVEFGEMAAVREKDERVTKGWVTGRMDNYRAPYARRSEDHPRTTVPCGTTNEKEFLQDPTGWRRYRPVTVGRVDRAWIRAHRAQLFAEAVELYKAGTTWWFDEDTDIAHRMRRFAAPYQVLHPWTETVYAWLVATANDPVLEVFSVVQVLGRAIGRAPVDIKHGEATSMGNILTHLGCEWVGRSTEEGQTTTRYRRPASMRVAAAGSRPTGTVTSIQHRG